MRTLKFEGWNIGMKKISFYLMLKNESHLTLKESKSICEGILRSEIIEVTFENEEIAKNILGQSLALGVKCSLKK